MKKNMKFLAAIGIAGILVTMALPKLTQTSAQRSDSELMHQTMEEFLDSGVKIEYSEEAMTK